MTESRHFQKWRSYHVTHRCHGRDFLLGAGIDRDSYLRLMREARRGRDMAIMSYMITSNHVHLLLAASGHGELSGFMAHVSGGMARRYNSRKGRCGSFWEGRYRATLIQDGRHLSRCVFYIALNMVRAGVVSHPREWAWCSHLELTGERQRYRLIDTDLLLNKLEMGSSEAFPSWYGKTLDAKCRNIALLKREPWWSESSYVGSHDFVASLLGKRQREDIVTVSKDTSCFSGPG